MNPSETDSIRQWIEPTSPEARADIRGIKRSSRLARETRTDIQRLRVRLEKQERQRQSAKP